MKTIQDQDITYYIRVFLVGLCIFFGLGFLFFFIFHDTYEIHIKNSQFEYGQNVCIVDQIESIGNTKISDTMRISENTIQTENYEVTFDPIKTKKLGKQTIFVDFSDPEIKDTSLSIQIIDTRKPVITVKKEQPVELTLKQVQEKEWNSLFTIRDNHTPVEKMKLSMKLNKESFKPGDDLKLILRAQDASGNKASRTIRIHIQKEKKEKEENPKEEQKTPQQETSNSSIPESRPESNDSYAPPVQQPTPPPAPRPANKQFLFSDGYDMSTAPSACQQELLASGRAGACTPLQDAEGIYYGMQLTYY